MTAFIPESIQILGTDGGGLTVILCSMYVDTIADLPAPTAFTGFRLSMGCTARAVNDNSRHRINSAGQWVDITENDGEYRLPPATSNSLGGIMVGSGLTIDSAGMLSGDFTALWDSIYQTEKHLTGAPPLSFMASGNGIEAAVIYGNGQQQGTPSPQNIVPFDGTGERTAQLLDIKDGTQTINGVVWTAYHGTITGQGTTTAAADSDAVIVYDGTFTRGGNYINYCKIQASKSIKPPAGTYTFSANADPSSNDVVALIVGDNDTYYYNSTARKIAVGETFSVNGDEYVMLVVSSIPSKSQYNFADIMLNSGSTALPYEPHGWAEKITCAGQTVPVYLGQTQTVRRVKKLVLTGEENISRLSSGVLYFTPLANMVPKQDAFCSHYKHVRRAQSDLQTNEFTTLGGAGQSLWFKTEYDTVDDFKSYLASQYAAGTPVTVWYVLAEPETGIVNEPLCKIGDYADELHSTDAGISIQTVRGQNTLTIATTLQPSEISITYF